MAGSSLDRALELDRIDLHLHTTVSDGAIAPEQIVELADRYLLKAISITDHDAVDAYETVPPGQTASGLLVITGVEIDTDAGGCDPEILGYGFDPDHPALAPRLREIQEQRRDRIDKMRVATNRALGKEAVTREEVFRPGRIALLKPHLTGPMVARGLFATTEQARRFLAEKLDPIPFDKPSPEQAIEWVHQAGGKAMLAHPGFYKPRTDLDRLVARLAEAGLDGLEGDYPYRATPSVFPDEKSEQAANADVARLADQHGLVLTRGTDSHTPDDWTRRHPEA